MNPKAFVPISNSYIGAVGMRVLTVVSTSSTFDPLVAGGGPAPVTSLLSLPNILAAILGV